MLDALITVEIQALRLKLHGFANQQNDLALQIHCVAVDSNLARVLDCQDNQTLRELARSVAQLDQAVRNSRPRSLDVEEADNHVARLFDARPDAAPVVVEPPLSGPRVQWLAFDLQSSSHLG
jgi:acylphosphatase